MAAEDEVRSHVEAAFLRTSEGKDGRPRNCKEWHSLGNNGPFPGIVNMLILRYEESLDDALSFACKLLGSWRDSFWFLEELFGIPGEDIGAGALEFVGLTGVG